MESKQMQIDSLRRRVRALEEELTNRLRPEVPAFLKDPQLVELALGKPRKGEIKDKRTGNVATSRARSSRVQ